MDIFKKIINAKVKRPFLALVIAWSSGIIFSQLAEINFSYPAALLFIIMFSAFVFLDRKMPSSLCLLIMFFVLGHVYTISYSKISEDHINNVAKYYRKKDVELKGKIASEVAQKKGPFGIKTSFKLNVNSVRAPWGWQKKEGMVLVNIFRKTDFGYGDEMFCKGKLSRPYDFSKDKNFSYPEYLARRGIRLILNVKKTGEAKILKSGTEKSLVRAALKFKDALKSILDKYLTDSEAGVLQAMLLGDRTKIPSHVRELFVLTGTAHILAISGLHIGIIAAIFIVVLKVLPVKRVLRLIILIMLLAGYMFLTGMRASVMRATIMISVYFAGHILEKEFDGINTLCLAAFLLLAINPHHMFDVGFQLSFVCVASIMLFQRKIETILQMITGPLPVKGARKTLRIRMAKYLTKALSLSISVWLGVAGLIAYYFEIITPITVLANLIVVPLVAVVLTLGFGVLGMHVIMPFLAVPFAVCTKIVMNSMVALIFLLSKAPGAYFWLRDVNIWGVIVYYVVVLGIFLFPLNKLVKIFSGENKMSKLRNFS